jgi:hypothetical protein
MKFLMTYAADPKQGPPTAEQMAAIGKLTHEMIQSGVVLMTGGLVRPTKGIQVKLEAGKFTVLDGPFPETKELIDGFALIAASSKAEAIEHARRFMSVAGEGQGEILQVFEPMEIPG